jgi:hypothetical protein
MPAFNAPSIVRWLHFVLLSMAGGGAVVALLLSGYEDENTDLRGLAATIWKRTVTWGFRLALLAGIGLLILNIQSGNNLLHHRYFHIKLTLVLILLVLSEMAPKALALGKRGAALLALLLFMLASFVVYNQDLFSSRVRALPMPAPMGTLHADR